MIFISSLGSSFTRYLLGTLCVWRRIKNTVDASTFHPKVSQEVTKGHNADINIAKKSTTRDKTLYKPI